MRISDWSSDVCSSDLATQCKPGSEDNAAPDHRRQIRDRFRSEVRVGSRAVQDIRCPKILVGERAEIDRMQLPPWQQNRLRWPRRARRVRDTGNVVSLWVDHCITGCGHIVPTLVETNDRKSTRLNSSH